MFCNTIYLTGANLHKSFSLTKYCFKMLNEQEATPRNVIAQGEVKQSPEFENVN